MIRTLLAGLALVSALTATALAQPDGESFDDWRAGFRDRLEASGATPETVSSMLDGLEPDMARSASESPDW